MKITGQYYNNFRCDTSIRLAQKPLSNRPSFGIRFKPKILTDIFSSQKTDISKGISKIKNVHSGEYGTECSGSMPLVDFDDSFGIKELEKLYKVGYSTNVDAYANCFLKSSADKPLSTSSVYDCSVMYLYNKEKNTHFLYHTYFDTDKKEFEFIIKTFMPEGFSAADIIPGDKKWYLRHLETMTEMFKALKASNKNVPVKIYHVNSKLPEIVGCKGRVFEIKNSRTSQGFSDMGQASFQICDLQVNNTVWPIINRLGSREDVEQMRKKINQSNYDIEIKKVLNNLLDKQLSEIMRIDSCNTIEELKKLINSYTPGKSASLFVPLSRKKANLISRNPSDKV